MKIEQNNPALLTAHAMASSDNESMCDLDLLVAPNADNDEIAEETKKTEIKIEEIDPEKQRLLDLGIPENLHRFAWLHTNCNELTQQNRDKIVLFMTGQYMRQNV